MAEGHSEGGGGGGGGGREGAILQSEWETKKKRFRNGCRLEFVLFHLSQVSV